MPKVKNPDQDVDQVNLAPGEVVTPEGEIVSAETVEYSYTREGRHEVGKEYPNPIPIAPPIGWVPSDPVHEVMARMVAREFQRQREAELGGEEVDSPEEADDFDIGEDFDPQAPYEHDFEPTMPWPATRAALELEQQINERRNQSRIATLRAELEAISNGRPWPPEQPSKEPPARGGGGAEPPGGQPNSDA